MECFREVWFSFIRMDQPSSRPPYPHQVAVVSPRSCAPFPIDLTMVQKVNLTSHRWFVVTDISDNIVFEVRMVRYSWCYSLILLDATGNPLLTLRSQIESWHSRM